MENPDVHQQMSLFSMVFPWFFHGCAGCSLGFPPDRSPDGTPRPRSKCWPPAGPKHGVARPWCEQWVVSNGGTMQGGAPVREREVGASPMNLGLIRGLHLKLMGMKETNL